MRARNDDKAPAGLAGGGTGRRGVCDWWAGHSRSLSEYMVVQARGRRGPMAAKALGRMLAAADGWRASVPASRSPAAAGLMAEHVAAERDVVDAVVAGDRRRLEEAGARLAENSRRHALAYGTLVPSLPDAALARLLAEHSALVVECAAAYVTGDIVAYVAKERQRAANTLALGSFCGEWL